MENKTLKELAEIIHQSSDIYEAKEKLTPEDFYRVESAILNSTSFNYISVSMSFHYFEGMFFGCESFSLVDNLKGFNFETMNNQLKELTELRQIVKSLSMDMKTGILKTRVSKDKYDFLSKELAFFESKHVNIPCEYNLDYFVTEKDCIVSFETTSDIHKRFKEYLGITILR